MYEIANWLNTLDQVEEKALMTSAYRWLCRWAGAGFPFSINGGGKIVSLNVKLWPVWFDDGPDVLSALRPQIERVLRLPAAGELVKPEYRACYWHDHTLPYFVDMVKTATLRVARHETTARRLRAGDKNNEPDPAAADKTLARIPGIVERRKAIEALIKRGPL